MTLPHTYVTAHKRKYLNNALEAMISPEDCTAAKRARQAGGCWLDAVRSSTAEDHSTHLRGTNHVAEGRPHTTLPNTATVQPHVYPGPVSCAAA